MKKQIAACLLLAMIACKKEKSKTEETPFPAPTPSAGWKIINHDSTGNLITVRFYDANYGYFISDKNYLLRTKNGGQSFTALALPANMMALGVTLIDSVSLIVSYNYATYKTTNGGETWTSLQTSMLSSSLNDGYFLNATTGFIGGNNCILKTTDGGTNWQQLNVGSGSVRGVKFTSAAVGWADNGSGEVYRTADGGDNWTTLNTGFTSSANLFVLNDNVAWAYYSDIMTSNVALKRTSNGGQSWETIYTSSSQLYGWTKLAFTDENNGFAAGWAGYLSSTGNSGSSWQQTSAPSFTQSILNFDVKADGKGWACGMDGLILKYN